MKVLLDLDRLQAEGQITPEEREHLQKLGAPEAEDTPLPTRGPLWILIPGLVGLLVGAVYGLERPLLALSSASSLTGGAIGGVLGAVFWAMFPYKARPVQ